MIQFVEEPVYVRSENKYISFVLDVGDTNVMFSLLFSILVVGELIGRAIFVFLFIGFVKKVQKNILTYQLSKLQVKRNTNM